MCTQCDELKKKLEEERMTKVRITPKYWWTGMVATILIFIVTTIYASGGIANQIEEHVKSDPTFERMIELFITRQEYADRKEEVNKDMDDMKKMLLYLYQKEGGKPLE